MKHLLLVAVLSVSFTAAAASEFQAGLQAYRSGDYGKALAALAAAAEAGDPRAAQLLADLYTSGRGVVPDPAIALQWRLRAAELGDPGAQYVVGMLYLGGGGLSRDPDRAAYWLERAAQQNHPNAALELGRLQLERGGDPASGLTWMRRAADQGLFDAQQSLANLYRNGWNGVPTDAEAASRWATVAKQNAETGQQLSQSVMQQQDAVAIARNTYYYGPAYGSPWLYPTWGVGWSRYGRWNYGVGVGGVWW